MSRPKFRSLGLCAVVLGLMAFGSTVVRAEVGAQWLLAEKAPSSGLIAFLDAQIDLGMETTGVLHSKVLGITFLVECTEVRAINAKLLSNGSIGEKAGVVANSKIKFSGCIVKLNGVESVVCQPLAGGTEKGVINTNSLHGLIVLHNTEPKELVQILPDIGEVIATIEMGKECPVGTKIPVLGKSFVKDSENAFLTHKVVHRAEVGPLTELWVISKTAEHVATILGSASVFLAGTHLQYKFSGKPA